MKVLFGILFLTALGGFAFYSAMAAVRSGQLVSNLTGDVRGKAPIRRSESPKLFWARIVAQFGLAAGCIAVIGYTLAGAY